ncbi:hypothetical protein B808_189 [Fructilactobacillus florum 8D]|uniref:Uncharacterized protein n=2 Tax=Fructilactobacillus florum TaxID=640331 RepID=W9EMP1_9LACO|nr:hypothetical protein [Fructilactobacillus florum]ETO40909.1 hypothetical protein B808_189 [Fructilactobacillus florum 8D]KRM91388.1 hypothetical protein FC87_GL000899 [Fructilactobacillus florum DSM 22689 = JCM 16035]
MNEQPQEILPGTPAFDRMVFRLKKTPTADNIAVFDFSSQRLVRLEPQVYTMPACLTHQLQIFFLVTKTVPGDWVMAFSRATMDDQNQVTNLSAALPTGQGLNLISENNPAIANQLLRYFQTLADANYGEWKLIG